VFDDIKPKSTLAGVLAYKFSTIISKNPSWK